MSNWTHYSSLYTGHPTLNGTAGSLTALLDAVLVNGTTAQSVTSITRSGSTATLTCAAHGIAIGDAGWREVSGAAETEYNGEFLMMAVTATTLTYTVAGTPATPATGTITYRTKPAGWSISHTGTNKRVYLMGAASVARKWFQILDNASGAGGAKEAALRGYNVMDSVDSGRYPFPTLSQSPAGLFIRKSTTADATVRQWDIWADDRTIYGFITDGQVSSSTTPCIPFYFGEYYTRIPGDTTACLIMANTSANIGLFGCLAFAADNVNNENSGSLSWPTRWAAGNGNGFNLATPIGIPFRPYSFRTFHTFTGTIPYPNNSDGGLYLTNFPLYRGDASGFPKPIGYLRGVFYVAHIVTNFTEGQLITGIADWSGYSFYIKTKISCDDGSINGIVAMLNNQNPPYSS